VQIDHPRQFRNNPLRRIRAELTGSDTCSAFGIVVKSDTPILGLCRKLVDAGHDPATPLNAYRGATLCLRVRSIGEAAGLRIATNSIGRPVFKREETRAAASPMRQTREAAE
jgi:hypothetical protein